jgi:prepilin-type processing-associated H-X9-DG protein
MLISLGWGTCLFFGCFCLAAAVFSWFFVPETAHKSLEQINALFADGNVDENELWIRIEKGVFERPAAFLLIGV